MATILTNKFKVRNAKAFMELFRTNNVYLFIGRNRAWSDEANPPTPSNLTALSDELDVWNDIIVMKNKSPFARVQIGKVAAKRYTSKVHEYILVFRKPGELETNTDIIVKRNSDNFW